MNLKEENQKLREQNEELKKLLWVAKNWIEREVKNSVVKRAKRKVGWLTAQSRDTFFNENVEEIITKRIAGFFVEMMIMNTPEWVIDNIISAELNYYNFKINPISDGFSVISSYHKAIDILIEEFITKWFRSFVMKNWKPSWVENNALEKSLYSIITKWYTLSIWRLYHLISIIKKWEIIWEYTTKFSQYIKEFDYLWDVILDKEFFDNFSQLVESEVLWKKRHSGKIDFIQTRDMRQLLIWDFKDKKCLIYGLLEIGKSDF